MSKIDGSKLHLLGLIWKAPKGGTGWAKVSAPVAPLVYKLPSQLVEVSSVGEQVLVRLTLEGQKLIDSVQCCKHWLKDPTKVF